MSFLRILLLALVAVALLVLALANRAAVDLRLLPAELAEPLGLDWSVRLPLFLVILGGVAIGLVLGFLIEWVREHRHRAEASRERAERERLEQELKRNRARTSEADEVLALIDAPSR